MKREVKNRNKILLHLLAAAALLFPAPVIAQNKKADSLRRALEANLPDTTRSKLLQALFNEVRFSDPLQALSVAREAKKIADNSGNQPRIAATTSKLGLIYGDLGNLQLSLDYQLHALRIYERLHDTLQIAGAQLNTAIVYKKQGSLDKALEWLGMSLENFRKKNNRFGEAYVYNNMAIIYHDRDELDKALEFHQRSLAIKEELKDSASLGTAYLNLGLIWSDKGESAKAMDYYNRAVLIYTRSGNLKGFAGVYNNIGFEYLTEGELDKAKGYLQQSLDYAQRIHSKEDEMEAHLNLSRYYERVDDYDKAALHYNFYRDCKDSLLNESGSKQIALLQAAYETDKKESELEGLRKDASISAEQLKRGKVLILAAAGGLVLVLVLVLLLYSRYRMRIRLNKELAETNERINYRKKEITDSISYARRIQDSILPRFERFKDMIPQSFLLHKPRQIVSGDFYWLHRDGNYIYLAVADNVLHGVPGAFISMVGVNILNSAIENKHVQDLAQLVGYMDKGVREMLSEGAGEAVGRRINISVCRLNTADGTLEFISTDNPLYLVNSKGVSEISTPERNGRMEVSRLTLKKGDTLYMFTDGYVDQMGGGEGKKMLTRKVSEILHHNWPVPVEKQKEELLHEFESWRGNYEQVDDVLIIGMRV